MCRLGQTDFRFVVSLQNVCTKAAVFKSSWSLPLLATFFLIFSAVTMAKGPQFHETPKEIDMMMRRREIRQRLQQEFNRVMYNPYRIAHHIEIVSWRTHFPNLYLAEPIL